jgi:hypothetical protein
MGAEGYTDRKWVRETFAENAEAASAETTNENGGPKPAVSRIAWEAAYLTRMLT